MINKMREIIDDKDENMKILATAIGYNPVQVRKYLNHVNTPPIDFLIAFCKHYGVSADYILGLPKNLEWPR